jgi:hypothetical protein
MQMNTITIMDLLNYSTNSVGAYKVVATDYNDNSVCLTGSSAIEYIKQTYLKGYTNTSTSGNDSGILPPGVRIVGENYVVFERPPTYQNVFYNINRVEEQSEEEDQEENIHVFRIPLPWQIYIATYNKDFYINEVYMFFSDTSLLSKDQNIYLAPLPNFYTSGLLCRPVFAHMEEVERYPKNISGVIAGAYDWIWNNGTNNDLNEAMVHINLQIAKDPDKRSSTVFSKMEEEIYNRAFIRQGSSPMYYDSTRVIAILKSWEQCTIEEVVNYKWPNFSLGTHFDSSVYSPVSSDQHQYITEHSNFYDHLSSWAHAYYEEDYSSEDIDYMIENGDYNHDAYYEYVVDNGYIPYDPELFKPEAKMPPLTLDVAVNRLASQQNNSNIRSLFNNYVQKAFEISQNKVASSS